MEEVGEHGHGNAVAVNIVLANTLAHAQLGRGSLSGFWTVYDWATAEKHEASAHASRVQHKV